MATDSAIEHKLDNLLLALASEHRPFLDLLLRSILQSLPSGAEEKEDYLQHPFDPRRPQWPRRLLPY